MRRYKARFSLPESGAMLLLMPFEMVASTNAGEEVHDAPDSAFIKIVCQ
jgi:hypothetical protein